MVSGWAAEQDMRSGEWNPQAHLSFPGKVCFTPSQAVSFGGGMFILAWERDPGGTGVRVGRALERGGGGVL